jgi:hypothetical protein
VSEVPGCQTLAFFKLRTNTQQNIVIQAPGLQKWALKVFAPEFEKCPL